MKTLLLFFVILFSLTAFTQRSNMAILSINKTEKIREKSVKKPVFHTSVERSASFQGNRAIFIEYINDNIEYPELARENNREGVVIVEFTVEADGSITNAEIVKSIGLGCDEVALKLVNEMPKWTPAQQGVRAVQSRVRLPLAFYL